MTFAAQIGTMVLLYASWGIAAGVVLRRMMLLCLCVGAIAGTGAYSYALAAPHTGVGVAWIAAAVGGAMAGWAAVAMAGKLDKNDYTLGSFAAMLVWESLVGGLTPVTGGPFGIAGLPTLPTAQVIGNSAAFVMLGTTLAAVSIAATRWERLRRLHTAAGIVARSRELADSFGISHRAVFAAYGGALGAICGIGGALLAAFIGYVGPSLISLATSVQIAALALAYARGVMMFALLLVFMVAVPELLRLLSISGVDGPSVRIAFAGFALLMLGLGHSRASAAQ